MNHRYRHLHLRSLVRIAATALAMGAPAAATAAESAAGEGSVEPASRLLERVSDPLEQAAAGSRAERRDGPLHPVRGRVGYGDAEAAFGSARGRPHEGQDVFAAAGAVVIAPADGVVVDGGSDGGRGNWLAIFDPERELTYSYFHMLEPAVAGARERVEAGQAVGRVGCSGSCWGDHLHFEIREGRGPYGAAIDPMPMLQRWRQLKR
jgi:murein DD-endopeptidase MepM/ murein hydrolase activator NlpD